MDSTGLEYIKIKHGHEVRSLVINKPQQVKMVGRDEALSKSTNQQTQHLTLNCGVDKTKKQDS